MQVPSKVLHAAIVALFLFPGMAAAADWFVAPMGVAADPAASGSETSPFATVEVALNSGKIKGGDTIFLLDGSHGKLLIKNRPFDTLVTIRARNDKKAHVSGISIDGTTRNIALVQLSLWPDNPLDGNFFLIRSYAGTSGITLDGLNIYGARDANDFGIWDASFWIANKYSGVFLQGTKNIVVRNEIIGVRTGISVSGADTLVEDNLVNGFSADGLVGNGDNNVFRRNRVFNCIKIDDTHRDGFQSFSGSSGRVQGLLLDSNIVIEWTLAPDHPLRCGLQGFGLYDGFYDNLTIVNNLVSVTAPHGISVFGGRNATIINNTVVHTMGHSLTWPYVAVRNHKNGTPSSDVFVSNNVAMSLQGSASEQNRVVFKSNSIVGTPGAVFENAFTFNYRPKASSGFIDTGDVASAPSVDIMGRPRPAGNGPDRGAYELVDASTPAQPTAPEAGPEPTTETLTEPELVVTQPVVTEPVVIDPVVADPISTVPVVTEPVVAEPVLKAPTVKKPVGSRGKDKPAGRLVIGSVGSLMKAVFSRVAGITF